MLEHMQKRASYSITSNDGGITWTEPQQIPSVLNGFRHVARYLSNGKLMISFGTRSDSHYPNDWVAWIGSYDDVVSGSSDGDLLIRIKQNKTNRDWGYSGLEVNAEGECVATCYGTWEADQRPYIISATFDPAGIPRP